MSAALAAIGRHGELEGVIVCLLIVALISAAIYFVVTYGFKQPWGAPAAAIVFVIGAILCLV